MYETNSAGGSLRDAWNGIKNMAFINTAIARKGYGLNQISMEELPHQLNAFFARFERHAFSADLLELKRVFVV